MKTVLISYHDIILSRFDCYDFPVAIVAYGKYSV